MSKKVRFCRISNFQSSSRAEDLFSVLNEAIVVDDEIEISVSDNPLFILTMFILLNDRASVMFMGPIYVCVRC